MAKAAKTKPEVDTEDVEMTKEEAQAVIDSHANINYPTGEPLELQQAKKIAGK